MRPFLKLRIAGLVSILAAIFRWILMAEPDFTVIRTYCAGLRTHQNRMGQCRLLSRELAPFVLDRNAPRCARFAMTAESSRPNAPRWAG
jgi:accessory gene regulator protein AgrB